MAATKIINSSFSFYTSILPIVGKITAPIKLVFSVFVRFASVPRANPQTITGKLAEPFMNKEIATN